jgi:hypothetical protein
MPQFAANLHRHLFLRSRFNSEAQRSNERHLINGLQKLEHLHPKTRGWLVSALVDNLLITLSLGPKPSVLRIFRDVYNTLESNLAKNWRRDLNLDSLLSDGLDAESLEFLEWIGRDSRHIQVHCRQAPTSPAAKLTHHFSSDPQRKRGLLPIIAELAIAGAKCILSRETLQEARDLGDAERDYANILTMARDDLSLAEISESATALRRSVSSDRATSCALKVAVHTSLEQAANLAVALLEVPDANSEVSAEAANEIRQILVEYLTKTPSELGNLGVWERLQLPRRLD